MSVSVGFLKKINEWVVEKELNKLVYLPFQVNGNPYKCKVFLVGAKPEPFIQMDIDELSLIADALVDEQLFQLIIDEYKLEATREYKGSLNFSKWMKEQWNETVLLSSVNCLIFNNEKQLKLLKKRKDPMYIHGFELFEMMVSEFEPEILIIQGSATLKLFQDNFGDKLLDVSKDAFTKSIAELEGEIYGKFPLENGKIVNVIVTKSMSYFGENGKSFVKLKQHLQQLL